MQLWGPPWARARRAQANGRSQAVDNEVIIVREFDGGKTRDCWSADPIGGELPLILLVIPGPFTVAIVNRVTPEPPISLS